jgi:FMN phosphatase YigB (HAD superfamily)
MNKISFVYFDVGGVALKDFSDTSKWDTMISDALGIPDKYHSAFNELYDKYELDICLGKITVDDLRPLLKEKFHATFDTDFSLLQYFVDHFESNSSLWPIVAKLQAKQINLGLLTDQYPGMLDLITARHLLPPADWNAIIDSSKLGIKKPMPEIYQIAQKQARVPAKEILFIDNRQKNLVIPQKLGWLTYLFDSRDYEQSNQGLSHFFRENL